MSSHTSSNSNGAGGGRIPKHQSMRPPQVEIAEDNSTAASLSVLSASSNGSLSHPFQQQKNLLSPSSKQKALAVTRLQSPSRGPTSPLGGGPPANIRKVSSSIHDVLVPPRQRLSPSRARAAAAGNVPSFHRQGTLTKIAPPQPQQPPPGGGNPSKSCSVLGCEGVRVLGEGCCATHLSDTLAGLKLHYKRSESTLNRFLQPRESAQRLGTGLHGSHAIGVRKHGLAALNSYEIMGITESNGTANGSAPPRAHPQQTYAQTTSPPKAAASTQARPLAKVGSSATVGSSVRRIPAKVGDPISHASQAAKFVRHSSVGVLPGRSVSPSKKPAAAAASSSSASTTNLASPNALASPARLLQRKDSFGLEVEHMPTSSPSDDACIASLPFHRFHFPLPGSLHEFLAWRDGVSAVPEGGAVAMIVALVLWAEGKELASGGVGWGSKRPGHDQAALLGGHQHSLLSRAPSSRSSKAAADASAASVQAGLLRRVAGDGGGIPTGVEEAEEEEHQAVARRLASLSRKQIGGSSSNGNGAPPRGVPRLTSFHRASPSAKKLHFTSGGTNGVKGKVSAQPPPQAPALGGWTMDSRWQALIACVHPDQTVPASMAQSAAGGPVPSHRARSLCALDVETLTDWFESSPHAARSFVTGTHAGNNFLLPAAAAGAPAASPPQVTRGLVGQQEDAFDDDGNERASALRLMDSSHGSFSMKMSRHPFAGGSADVHSASAPVAIMLLHNGALPYPRSIKLRKDSSGHWKAVHFWNLLVEARQLAGGH